MEIVKKTGVNYDYILAIKIIDGKVRVIEYPIIRHNKEIDRAIELYYDESCDAAAIYSIIKNCLGERTFNYCLDHEYTDSYIKKIEPVWFPEKEYKEIVNSGIEKKVKYRIGLLPESLKNNKETIRVIKEEIWEQLYPYIKKTKEELLIQALPYIYASDYDNTISENGIEQECIVFSSERPGDGRDMHKFGYHVEHQINDDISIRVETNFCYGRSSYFSVVVTYKGIEILPYSVWVHYYYAGYVHLLRYTRSYIRQRNSWHECMKFLEFFINSAIENPVDFIHNEVMYEVNGLIEGLERIFNMNQEDFEKEIRVKKRLGDKRYIGILGARYANNSDEKQYNIAPCEVSMIYRIEKVCGALRFLRSLRKLKEIYGEVSTAINTIIELNKRILPDVKDTIFKINEEIEVLQKEKSKIEDEYYHCNKDYKGYDRKLNNRILFLKTPKDIEEVKENFYRCYPQYKELEIRMNKLRSKERIIDDKIGERKRLVNNLEFNMNMILREINRKSV